MRKVWLVPGSLVAVMSQSGMELDVKSTACCVQLERAITKKVLAADQLATNGRSSALTVRLKQSLTRARLRFIPLRKNVP